MNLNVAICGGGSLGIVCASVFVSQGITVSILTDRPERWSQTISATDCNGKTYGGVLARISNDPADVIPQADIVLLCVPGYLIEKKLLAIKPYIGTETKVGSIVASTGFFFTAHQVLEAEQPLFGFQRVPYIARVEEYGKRGLLLGYKPALNVAIEHVAHPEEFAQLLSGIFSAPIHVLDNYYEASLTNSNPILHTARLYSMWRGRENDAWDKVSKFYTEWTDRDSEILIKMDEEFMNLLRVLQISRIPPLLEYYESHDARSLTQKIRSIRAFKDIPAPMKEDHGLWTIDFSSRYFTEDFRFGLRFIYDLAESHHLETPTIDEVYQWGIRWSDDV